MVQSGTKAGPLHNSIERRLHRSLWWNDGQSVHGLLCRVPFHDGGALRNERQLHRGKLAASDELIASWAARVKNTIRLDSCAKTEAYTQTLIPCDNLSRIMLSRRGVNKAITGAKIAGSASTMTDERQPRVRFFYIKSNQFRVVHVDGAVGAITPRGNLHIAVYSERPAIPRQTEHELNLETGQLGEPISTEGKEGVIREMEVDLMLSAQATVELRDWLNKRIEEFDQIKQASQQRDRDGGKQ
jgi:hypothetical protein